MNNNEMQMRLCGGGGGAVWHMSSGAGAGVAGWYIVQAASPTCVCVSFDQTPFTPKKTIL